MQLLKLMYFATYDHVVFSPQYLQSLENKVKEISNLNESLRVQNESLKRRVGELEVEVCTLYQYPVHVIHKATRANTSPGFCLIHLCHNNRKTIKATALAG